LQTLSSGGRIDFWAGLGYTECALGRVPNVRVFKQAATIDRFITKGKTTRFTMNTRQR
jgi:hypothetical protein